MKIADVTVGTEYAFYPYAYGESDWNRLQRSDRVLVTDILPGGKVLLEHWDRHSKTFVARYPRPQSARGLVMTWAEALPIFKEIRERREADAKAAAERMAREQASLRRLGDFLDDHDAMGMNGVPFNLKGAIDLARGVEQNERGWANRHEANVPLNVNVLVHLLAQAAADGYRAASEGRPAPAWTEGVE